MTERPDFQERADEAFQSAKFARGTAAFLLCGGLVGGIWLGTSHPEANFKTDKGVQAASEYVGCGALLLSGIYIAGLSLGYRREYELNQKAANDLTNLEYMAALLAEQKQQRPDGEQ